MTVPSGMESARPASGVDCTVALRDIVAALVMSTTVRAMSEPSGGVETPLSTVRSTMTGTDPPAGTENGFEQTVVPAASPSYSVNSGTMKQYLLVWAAFVRLVTVHVKAAACPGTTWLYIVVSA